MKTEGSRQKAEGGKQKAEGGRRKAEAAAGGLTSSAIGDRRVSRTREDRAMARRMRDGQWDFAERVAATGTVWFSPWDKERRTELADELRCCLISGVEMLYWLDQHPEWWEIGEWDHSRQARPIRLTAAGRAALVDRAKYDMEPVYWGLVEPGRQTIPAARRAK